MSNRAKHPMAGKTITLKSPDRGVNGYHFVVEDYWQNVTGGSWMDADGNPAAMTYAMRSGMLGLPIDNEVLYGKVGAIGLLIHVSELGDVVENDSEAHWNKTPCVEL